MATGIQSSQSAGMPGAGAAAPTPASDAHLADAQKLPVNKSAAALEQNQKVSADDKEVSEKVYHGLPGSSFFWKDGTRYEFDAKGVLVTKSELLQKELDQIADKPGSPIYAKNLRPTPAPGDDEPVKQIQTRAAETMAAIRAATK